MHSRFSNIAVVPLVAFIAISIAELVYCVLGGGRSWGAYVLGTAVLLGSFLIIIMAVALFDWLSERAAVWLRRLVGRRPK